MSHVVIQDGWLSYFQHDFFELAGSEKEKISALSGRIFAILFLIDIIGQNIDMWL